MIVRSVGLCAVLLATVSASYAAGDGVKAKQAGNPLPTDWTHRHVVFSQPATPEQAARVQKDVRYLLQQRRESLRPLATLEKGPAGRAFLPAGRPRRSRKLHPDWSVSLGSGGTVGAARYPAKFSFNLNVAKCGLATNPDFVIYPTGLAGVSGVQPSIDAFTNLYSGCPTGPIPADYWAYNTGGTVQSSPVLSLDGTQVAFVQNNGLTSSLVLLKWKPFDGLIGSPTDITPVVLISDYVSCPILPCMAAFDLGATASNSSAYYDYGNDLAFVGDDAGKLHQFTGVFKGTPAEVTSGGWPVTVNLGLSPLTSPVHDPSPGGQTYVNDSAGFLYRVDASGVVTASGQLDAGAGLVEGPMIDPSAGSVYVFSSDDGTGIAAVFQLSTTFIAGDLGIEAPVGIGTTLGSSTTPMYDGAWDHNYILSPTATGNLYVCGNPGGKPTLYQIPILLGVMELPVKGPVLSGTANTPCSPVSDVYNPNVTGAGLPQEWVFLSVEADGNPAGCLGFSCVMNFKDTSWQPSTVYNLGQEILDSHMNIQVAENSGATSGLTPPAWSGIFGTTNDNGVHWRNQGPLTAVTPDAWAATTLYPGGSKVLDANNNIEVALPAGGTSGSTLPIWGSTEGSTVTDGTVTWVNLGANTVFGLAESGGTSGIIIDNLATSVGSSQIYFSTLQDIGCGRGGTGGCAVQASQQDLQ